MCTRFDRNPSSVFTVNQPSDRWADGWRANRRRPPGSWEASAIVVAAAATAAATLQFGAAVVLLPIAIVVAAAITLVDPRVGFVCAVFLAPFDAYIPGLRIYKDFLWSDLLLLALIAAALARWERWRLLSLEHAIVALGLIAIGLFEVVSMVSSADWTDTIDNGLRFACFAAVVLLTPSLVDVGTIRIAAAALVFGVCARFGVEAVHYFDRAVFVFHPSYQFGVWTSNPNTIAGFGSVAVPLGFSLAAAARHAVGRGFWIALVMATSAALVLSFSKGAWIAGAAGTLAWFAVARLPVRPWRCAAAAALLLIAIGGSPTLRRIPLTMVERWNSAASEISNAERLKYLRVAATLTFEHPIAGVGLEQFPDAFRRATGEPLAPDDPHDAYMFIASELGLFALAAFLVIWGALLAGAFRHAAGAPHHAGIFGALVALAVFQLFSSEPWNSRVFWLLATMPWPLAAAWPRASP